MTAEVVSIISDIAVGGSAMAVAGAALKGLRAWRKEMTGKAKFEVARNVMILGFKTRDLFDRARSPFTSSAEYQSRLKGEDESESVARVLNEWYSRDQRLQPLRENLPKLQEAAWEASVVLGKAAGERDAEVVKEYRGVYASVASAINAYFDRRHHEATIGHNLGDEGDEKWLIGLRQEFSGLPDDGISLKVSKATDSLESTLRPFVE